jgi:hypothetical protein
VVTDLLLVLTGTVGLAGLVTLAVRAKEAFLAVAFSVAVAEAASSFGTSGVLVSGVQVRPTDVICAALLISFVYETRGRRPSGFARIISLLILLTAISVGRGAAVNGMQAALNDGRSFLYVIAGLAFAATNGRIRRRGLLRIIAAVAVVLGAAAAVRFATVGIGTSTGRILSTGEYVDGRALDASAALLLAMSMLLLASNGSRVKSVSRWQFGLALALAPVVLLLQHRTVWAATVFALGLLLVKGRVVRRTAPAVVLALPVAAVAALLLGGGATSEAIASSYTAAINPETSTLLYRVESWLPLLRTPEATTPEGILAGQPMGSGYARLVRGVLVDISPHNFYIQVFLRLGILGLLALVGCVLLLLRPRCADTAWPQHGAATMWALVAAVLFFCVTYAPGLEHALLLSATYLGLTSCAVVHGAPVQRAR